MKTIFKVLLCALAAAGSPADSDADSFTVLHSFSSAEGSDPSPYSALATDGSALYGTARQRGPGLSNGTLYRLGLDGSDFTVLHAFTNSSLGQTPTGGLVVDGGTIYGSAESGGPAPSLGILFTINTDGSGFNILHSFHGSSDGESPRGDLLKAGDTLYGTTRFGGVWSQGVVYSINTNGGSFTVLHNFTNFNPNFSRFDGGVPFAGLTLSGSTLYGTTTLGGTNANSNGGTVYKLNTDGSGYKLLHSFTNSPAPDGISPYGRVIVAGEKLYGIATFGGTNISGTAQGVIFSMGTNGDNFTVIHSFVPSHGDGAVPFSGLTAVGNTIYGTASEYGPIGSTRAGTVFSFDASGSGYTQVHAFTNLLTGGTPYSELLLHNGSLYGTTSGGGAAGGYGTIFKLNVATQLSLTVTNGPGGTVISWPNDGQPHNLQSTTNLNPAVWVDLAPNWTNGLSIGVVITNTSVAPKMFFRLN